MILSLSRLLRHLRPPGPPRRRLATRIVAVSLLVLLLVQAAGYVVVRTGLQAGADAALAREFDVAEHVWQRLLEQRTHKLAEGAALLAADADLRAAAHAGDLAAVRAALRNHGARLDATLVALLDAELRPRALADEHPGAAALLARLGTERPDRRPGPWMTLVEQRPHQLVMVPLREPLIVGWVVMGLALDRGVANDMQRLTGLDVAVLAHGPAGRGAVAATTLDRAEAEHLLDEAAPRHAPAQMQALDLAAGPFVAHRLALPLHGGRGEVVLLRSMAEALAPTHPLPALMAAITLAGVVLLGLGGVVVARQVTTPLRRLVQASERLGRGDYDQPLEPPGRDDEVGELARAFDRMRANIAAHAHEAHQLAYWDRLTGLPNRAQFRDQVQAAIARCDIDGDGLSVLMLDLDRFKHVNDVLGYAFGDRLLAAVGERLRGQTLRRDDVIARLGGDEFAVLLPHGGLAQARAMAERVAAAFAAPLHLDDHLIDISAGVGIACWPTHAKDAEALLSRAEIAMYAAKRRTAGAQVYDVAIDSTSAQTLSLLSELRRAVEQGELRLFLQPKVDLASDRVSGAEALVRWQHPERGLLPPAAFIPFAEQTGFVRHLTLWMFEEGARQWSTLASLGLTQLSINLSTRDLLDQELPDKLDALLGRHRAPARAFCLEITESAIMDDPERAEATLARLHQRGFDLSIDDFGTGYSSLAYLKRLPVSELKIDRSFVMAMERDQGDAKIVRSTIDLAHNLGLSVVAEGVENQAVYDALRQQGCDRAQGYHMSRPLPMNEFIAWTARWQAAHAVAEAGSGVTSD